MNWLIISVVLLFIVWESLIVCMLFDKLNKGICYSIVVLISIYFIILSIFYKDFPTAMDVYQGKTDIEYIYKNGRVVDSTVVFKNVVYCK